MSKEEESVLKEARGLSALEKVNIRLSSKAGGELQPRARRREGGVSRFTAES